MVRRRCTCGARAPIEALVRLHPGRRPRLDRVPRLSRRGVRYAAGQARPGEPFLRNTSVLIRASSCSWEMCHRGSTGTSPRRLARPKPSSRVERWSPGPTPTGCSSQAGISSSRPTDVMYASDAVGPGATIRHPLFDLARTGRRRRRRRCGRGGRSGSSTSAGWNGARGANLNRSATPLPRTIGAQHDRWRHAERAARALDERVARAEGGDDDRGSGSASGCLGARERFRAERRLRHPFAVGVLAQAALEAFRWAAQFSPRRPAGSSRWSSTGDRLAHPSTDVEAQPQMERHRRLAKQRAVEADRRSGARVTRARLDEPDDIRERSSVVGPRRRGQGRPPRPPRPARSRWARSSSRISVCTVRRGHAPVDRRADLSVGSSDRRQRRFAAAEDGILESSPSATRSRSSHSTTRASGRRATSASGELRSLFPPARSDNVVDPLFVSSSSRCSSGDPTSPMQPPGIGTSTRTGEPLAEAAPPRSGTGLLSREQERRRPGHAVHPPAPLRPRFRYEP